MINNELSTYFNIRKNYRNSFIGDNNLKKKTDFAVNLNSNRV